MQHLYIFDYCACKIYHKLINSGEDFYTVAMEFGLKLSQCEWIYSDNELNIEEL